MPFPHAQGLLNSSCALDNCSQLAFNFKACCLYFRPKRDLSAISNYSSLPKERHILTFKPCTACVSVPIEAHLGLRTSR